MGIFLRAIEKRSHPSNPANWLLYGLGASNKAVSGVTVTEESSLSYPSVWSAVTNLAGAIASLPLHLYKYKAHGKDRADDHPLYNLLHLKPNPEMTSMTFRESMVAQVLLFGTFYAHIERAESDIPIALWPLLSANMRVERNNQGILIFTYRFPNGLEKQIDRAELLRLVGFSLKGITGINPIQKHVDSIGLGLALDEYGSRFFANNAIPPAVLEHPGQLGEKARDNLRKSWEEMHRGLSNAHRMAILEEGMKINTYGIDPEKAQALQSRSYQVGDIARIFNVPPHILKDLSRATFSNVEQQSLEYVIHTLRPWFVRIEQSLNTQLLTEKEQKKYFFEHSIEGLLRGDINTRYAAYSLGRQWGWLSANDIRRLENMNEVEGGDIYFIPLNMMPANEPFPVLPEETKSLREWRTKFLGRQRIINQYRPLFRDASQRIIKRESATVQKIIKKNSTERASVKDIEKQFNEFYDGMPEYVKKQMGPVIHSFSEAIQTQTALEINGKVEISPILERFISDYIETYALRHVQSSLRQLKTLLEEEPEKIQERVLEWEQTRADKIAFNESYRNANAIATVVFLGAGFAAVWRTNPDECEYCQTLNGKKIINLDQAFVNKGEEINVEGKPPMKIYQTKRHPPLHQGCACLIGIE